MDRRGECVKVAGFSRALCAAWRGDNAGPPGAEEVLSVFAAVQADFPSARVVASGFDAFARPLVEAVASGAVRDLPVVTSEVRRPWDGSLCWSLPHSPAGKSGH